MQPLTAWGYYEIALLALMVYREARGESHEAKIAVAHTVMNRVANPAWWGRDVVGVITKKWQYSSLTDPNDRQLTVWPQRHDRAFEECLTVAALVLAGLYDAPLKGIDSYYDDSIPAPKWAKPECFVGKIGRLSFFNTDGDFEKDVTDAAKPSV